MKYNLKDESTKSYVLHLHNDGLSSYKISDLTDISPRAIQKFLGKESHKEWWSAKEFENRLKSSVINSDGVIGACLTQPTPSLVDMLKKIHSGKHEGFILPKIEKKEDNSRILLISDMHIPYHHPDTLEFLQYLKDKYEPTRVICLGDELDKHALSFHDSDPDLPSAGHELKASLPVIKQLKEMFPVMDILESNHGSLLYRKANHHGIPRQYLKSYNQVLEVDDGWQWHFDMTITLPNGNRCYLHHGKSSNITRTSQTMGMCSVAGHYHETFKVEYWANPNGLYWALQAGCLIDDNCYAFNYNNVNLKRPIIGTGLIIDSMPFLEPMVLGKDSRWINRTN